MLIGNTVIQLELLEFGIGNIMYYISIIKFFLLLIIVILVIFILDVANITNRKMLPLTIFHCNFLGIELN